jgi:hypothetical protein
LNKTTPAEAGSGQETTTSGDFGLEIPGKVPESVPSLFFNSVKPHQFGGREFAFCPSRKAGFVRISSNIRLK